MTINQADNSTAVNPSLYRRHDNLLSYLILVAVALADFFNFWVAFQRFDRNASQVIALILVGAMTLTAIALMMFASHYWRKSAERHVASRVAFVLPMIFVWLALGAAAFAMRMALPPQATSGFGFAAPSASSTDLHNAILATLMFVLYLGAGIVSWMVEAKLENPDRTRAYRMKGSMWWRRAQRRAQRKAYAGARAAKAQQAKQYQQVTTEAAKLRELRAQAQADVAAIEVAHRSAMGTATHARTSLVAQGQELKSYARLRLAQELKQPAKTSGVFVDVRNKPDQRSAVGEE